jgi:hypothetical protein
VHTDILARSIDEFAEKAHSLRRVSREKRKESIKVVNVLIVVGAPNRTSISDDQSNPASESQLHTILGCDLSQPGCNLWGGEGIGDLALFLTRRLCVIKNTLRNGKPDLSHVVGSAKR